ncbi:actin-binding Rho-activating protein-like isoform X2 [Clavelina lepadiformis]|uniref:actin-binding Rho-activating protein-like isoform X2 n=1 Tax=Clavelina lepadiformis TaxID=159417 RepID=UPI0040428D6B
MSKETSDREKFVKTGSNDFGVSFLAERWNTKAENFIQKQKTNPFSGRYDGNERVRWIKGAKEYAQPVGLTAERGAKAKRYISKDIEVLCHIIEIMGKPDDNGNICTTFGELFERYTNISNKVVGTLLRARKYNLVDFSGEMLWQRRDDDVVITLLQ